MAFNIRTQLTGNKKEKPDGSSLGFGEHFTDHMFIMDYREGAGWHDPRIVPYAPVSLDPSAMILHYAQGVFEGLKAYRADNGRILLFRPEKNMERLNVSSDRLCIPPVDVDDAVKAVKKLVRIDADWIPSAPGTSLYIRPFIIATDPHLGIRQSYGYMFIIILSPVGAYYPEGLNPVRIYIEDRYVRAVRGGVGFTKTGGNYAASIRAQYDANLKDYTQVLWLDGIHRKYIEEVGAMNVFFKIDGKVVTPAAKGSILSGITRMSCMELLKSWNIPVEEREISVDEVFSAAKKGALEEAFGTGTAAVISPIGELSFKGDIIKISGGSIGETSLRLYDTLTGIQWGRVPDVFGWTQTV